jgi:hypothetical protein
MSCVCILTPVVIAAWPALSAAVVSAATSLGYEIVADAKLQSQATAALNPSSGRVQLDIPNSEVVTGQLGRDQRITVSRDGITITFSRDNRGRAGLCVTGKNYTDDQLRAAGEELSSRVVQRYVYQRLMDEMQARDFAVVEEEVDENHAIRLKVRHWEN